MNDTIFLIPHLPERKEMVSDAIESIGDYPYRLCVDEKRNGPAFVLQKELYQLESSIKYVVVFDDDDILIKDEFDILLDNFKKEKYSFGYSSYIRDYDNEVVKCKMRDMALRFSARGFKVYNRNMLERVGGFDPTIPLHYDYDICWRLFKSFGEYYWHENPCFIYRKHEGQITKAKLENSAAISKWIVARPLISR